MSLLNKKVIVPEKLNGLYSAKVKEYAEVENDKGGYVQVVFMLSSNREYTYTIFPSESDGLLDESGNLRISKWTDEMGKEHKGSQYNYVISSLAGQLNLPGEQDLATLLDAAKETEIGLSFSYNQDVGRMNVSFKSLPDPQEEPVEL